MPTIIRSHLKGAEQRCFAKELYNRFDKRIPVGCAYDCRSAEQPSADVTMNDLAKPKTRSVFILHPGNIWRSRAFDSHVTSYL
jgi:hypothetical protein